LIGTDALCAGKIAEGAGDQPHRLAHFFYNDYDYSRSQ
jgi:hypothetical protein